jgi:hypothetical protein
VEDCAPPRKSISIAALIEGESSKQAAMRNRSASPADKDNDHEIEEEDHLCWPKGGWPQLNLPPGPRSSSHEGPTADFFHYNSLHNVPEMARGEANPLYLDSQEDLWQGCQESNCKETSEDSGQDDYINEDNDCGLEDMFFPPELFHSV